MKGSSSAALAEQIFLSFFLFFFLNKPFNVMCTTSCKKAEVNLKAQRGSAWLAMRKTVFRIIKLSTDIINKRNYDTFGHRQNGLLIYEWPDGQFSTIKGIQTLGSRQLPFKFQFISCLYSGNINTNTISNKINRSSQHSQAMSSGL